MPRGSHIPVISVSPSGSEKLDLLAARWPKKKSQRNERTSRVFPKIGCTPKWMAKIMEIPTFSWDDLGGFYPLLSERKHPVHQDSFRTRKLAHLVDCLLG